MTRDKKLSQFSTQALEVELLNRQKRQFQRLTCQGKAETWITQPQSPTCFNCKQDILSLKDK